MEANMLLAAMPVQGLFLVQCSNFSFLNHITVTPTVKLLFFYFIHGENVSLDNQTLHSF